MYRDGDGWGYYGANPQDNLLHNPSFAIMQRQAGTESTDTSYASDAYAWDRWYPLTQTGNVQCSRQAGFTTRGRYCGRIKQQQPSAQRMGIAHIIEAQRSIQCRGQQFTWMPTVRGSAAQVQNFAILEWTSTADAVTSNVVNSWTNSTFTAGQFFLGSNLTVAKVLTPSALVSNTSTSFKLSAIISSSCNNIILFSWSDQTLAQNATLDFCDQWAGIGPGPLYWMEPDPGDELQRCLRYSRRLTVKDVGGAGVKAGTASVQTFPYVYSVSMRAYPTVTSSAPSWTAGAASGNQIGALNPATPAWLTISGGLTLGAVATSEYCILDATAGTSFSSTTGAFLYWSFGDGAWVHLSADL